MIRGDTSVRPAGPIFALRQRPAHEQQVSSDSRHTAAWLPVTVNPRRMMKFNYWMPSPCGDEWASHSLAELVVYLTRRYRQPTHQRMEAIAAVLPDFVPSWSPAPCSVPSPGKRLHVALRSHGNSRMAR
jgi:hypothetical protein